MKPLTIIILLLSAAVIAVWIVAWQLALSEDNNIETTAATIYIHGRCEDTTTGLSLAGCTVSLWYGGRKLRESQTIAGGWWGFEVSLNTGLYQLWFVGPPAYAIHGILPGVNTTDFEFLADPSQCQFRVSPAGGRTGDFFVYFQHALTPTATWIPTPTVTPFMPTPTFTVTPFAPTPTPTRTPGPTPTICWRDPSPEMVAQAKARLEAQFPLGDDPATRMGLKLGLGWPMFRAQVGGMEGVLFSPFSIVIGPDGDGCYSIIDGVTFQ